MAGRFELKATESGQYHFTLKAANHQVILSSERYTSKQAAKNGIRSVRKNAAHDDRFERKTAKNGKPFFVLKAGNHQVVGTSQMYGSSTAMEKAIASVRRNAPDAELVDATQLSE